MDTVETQSIFITPSEVIEYLYCPRFIYFMNCLSISQHEEQRYKVLKGREVHEERQKQNVDYIRKKIPCVKKDIDVYMSSEKYHLRGKVDEVLYMEDATLSPIDYKYAEYRENVFKTHKFQSILYGLLIMDTYEKEVRKGFIAYVRNGSKLSEIIFTERDFVDAKKILSEMLEIIQKGLFPKRTSQQIKCLDCCYKNICVK